MSDWAENDDEIKFPTAIIDFISHLFMWQDGLKCIVQIEGNILCNFMCRGIKNIQTHCRNQHGWINPRSQGRMKNNQHIDTTAFWMKSVRCQKFSTHGLLARLFEINEPSSDVQQVETSISQEFQGKRHLLISSINQAKKIGKRPIGIV